MKIGINVQYVGTRRGGAEKYGVTLARCLVQAGHTVRLFAREVEAGELPQQVSVHRVHPRTIPGTWWPKAYQFGRSSEFSTRQYDLDLIIGFDKTWHQDVYLAVGGPNAAVLDFSSRRFRSVGHRALWRFGKLISPKQWLFRWIARRQFHQRRQPHVIAPSRMTAEHFQRYHQIPSQRISVVYNAVDGDSDLPEASEVRKAFRRRHDLATGDVAVLFAARNYSLKGLQPLLEAFSEIAGLLPQARLLVCGSRREGPFRRMAKRRGLWRRVRFLQSVEDIRECFAAADLLAFPSFYDPCSLVVLEAMCAGLPVITTRQNGASELVSHGKDGFVIDSPWDLESLSRYMARLIQDAELRHRMGGEARRSSRSFTLDARMHEIVAVLERVASNSASRPASRKVA
jgi:UDP-glucose:(heptosyl)LPS alpha-1,3-glucosyltransferase